MQVSVSVPEHQIVMRNVETCRRKFLPLNSICFPPNRDGFTGGGGGGVAGGAIFHDKAKNY